MKHEIKFTCYDVLVEPFKIIQILAISKIDAINIAETRGFIVLDCSESLESNIYK